MRLRETQQISRHRDALCWKHLEPEFAAKVVRASTTIAAPLAASTAAETVSLASDAVNTLIAAAVALMLVALYVSVVFHLAGPGLTLLLIFSPIALFAITRALRHRQVTRVSLPRAGIRARDRISADSLALFDAADLTPIERCYADLLALVAQSPAASVATRDRRLLVREAGTLLAHWTRLEQQRVHLIRAASAQAIPNESAYAAALHASQPLIARIDEHQEAIHHALQFAHAALAYRIASAETLAPPPVETLYRVVLRLASETDAVENAVRELNTR